MQPPPPYQSIGGNYPPVNQPPRRRLVVSAEALEKEGKTHFALTAPGPIAYQSWDIGTEGVVEKFQSNKVIHKADYRLQISQGDSAESVMGKASMTWTGYVHDYRLAMEKAKSGQIKTLVDDTATDSWAVLRMARLGKLSQILPVKYVGVNLEYSNLIREIYETPANYILLHKSKAEWYENPQTGKSAKTGKFERAGFSDMGFLVQVNIRLWRDWQSGDFCLTVLNCRQNPGIAGMTLSGDLCSFPVLATLVYPDTVVEDWQ